MLSMTSPALPTTDRHSKAAPRARPVARRLVLVRAGEDRSDELIRRYRLARLRLEPREMRGDERFAHLKHSHD
jgi:hypothetical protein